MLTLRFGAILSLLSLFALSLGLAGETVLKLVNGQGNSITNDDWRSTQASQLEAILPPSNDKEAAIPV